MAYLTREQAQTLLGRSLSSVEDTSFDTYEALAETYLADALCVADIATLLTDLSLTSIPTDLQMVLARIFGGISAQNNVEFGVSSKKVEDFSITYDKDNDILGAIYATNGTTIGKYSECRIRYGRTLKEEARFYRHERI